MLYFLENSREKKIYISVFLEIHETKLHEACAECNRESSAEGDN
eukprot:jgi/Antlo1/2167/1035